MLTARFIQFSAYKISFNFENFNAKGSEKSKQSSISKSTKVGFWCASTLRSRKYSENMKFSSL